MAAVSGCEDAKLALMLLAVEPRLKGVLIASGPGTYKSLLARSFETILPPVSRRVGCRLVEVPLNVTEDRLLGGIDIELALSTGRRESAAGLLAQADGRALYVDEINLLETALINHLAAALESGVVRLERDGISDCYASNFALVGTYDPAEGELSPVLRDRVGLIVYQQRETAPDRRAEIVSRLIDPPQIDFECETARLAKAVGDATERLPGVSIPREAISRLSRAALELGVGGNRADIFALRAARASAALAGRDSVEEEDLLTAMKLVLMPRATRIPAPAEQQDSEPVRENGPDRSDSRGPQSEGSERPDADETGSGSGFRDLVLKAVDSRISLELPSLSPGRSARPVSGRSNLSKSVSGGRYVTSTPTRGPDRRVAIDATLRAAAPYQAERRKGMSDHPGCRAVIRAEDLRYKVLKRRTGALVIFAVDASGSMALNRVAQAKGAMTRLLEKAYLHRDKVAFISFRGEDASVLLPPTRSVALGKSLIDSLPTGGPTPIAKGLLTALEVARHARLQDKSESLLLIFTDGRANVGLRTVDITDKVQREAAIQEELRKIGSVMHMENVHPVVIDTRARYVSGGEGRTLARLLSARYLYLPRADAGSITSAVTRLATELRG